MPVMGLSRTTRRFTAWIACFAILLASLAPSISHAVEAARHGTSFWADECDILGEAHDAAKHDGNAGESHGGPSHVPGGLHFEHCPFCLTHAGSFALVQSSSPPVYQASDPPGWAGLSFQAPRLRLVWLTAQTRAPPASF